MIGRSLSLNILMSKMLGRALDLSEEDLVSLELVSTHHDIGKISHDRYT